MRQLHHRSAEVWHALSGISQCYLPPHIRVSVDGINHAYASPAEAVLRFTDLGGMESGVDLVVWFTRSENGHPSKYSPGPMLINFVDQPTSLNVTPPRRTTSACAAQRRNDDLISQYNNAVVLLLFCARSSDSKSDTLIPNLSASV